MTSRELMAEDIAHDVASEAHDDELYELYLEETVKLEEPHPSFDEWKRARVRSAETVYAPEAVLADSDIPF